MRCLTVFALFMWLLVVSRSSDYWLGISPRVTLIALVDVEVCLCIPSCVTRWVPRGSRGLILGSTGRGRPILGSTGRGRSLLYPASVFPTIHDNPCVGSPCYDTISIICINKFIDYNWIFQGYCLLGVSPHLHHCRNMSKIHYEQSLPCISLVPYSYRMAVPCPDDSEEIQNMVQCLKIPYPLVCFILKH